MKQFKEGQEVWVKAKVSYVHELDNGEVVYNLEVHDGTNSGEDWLRRNIEDVLGIRASQIVAEKPEVISGKVLIEYDLNNGGILTVRNQN